MQVKIRQIAGLTEALEARPTINRNISTQNGIQGGGALNNDLALSLIGVPLSLFNSSNSGFFAVSQTGPNGIGNNRSLLGSTGRISITNGNGVNGNPVIDLTNSIVESGSYNLVSVDSYGRVVEGFTRNTLAGLGIVDGISASGATMTGFLRFDTNIGLAAPTFNTRSLGSRLVVQNTLSTTSVDYAIGVENTAMWLSMPRADSSNTINFYGGATRVASLTGQGNLNLTGALTAISKSFLIDYPNKPGYKLQYASLEGPEHAIMFRGHSNKLNFTIPKHFYSIVDPSSISVHLTSTCLVSVYFCSINKNKVNVIAEIGKNNITKEPYFGYNYLVIGTRKDIPKLKIEIKVK